MADQICTTLYESGPKDRFKIKWRYVGHSTCSEAGCDKNREGRVCADVAIEKNEEIEIVEDVYDSDTFMAEYDLEPEYSEVNTSQAQYNLSSEIWTYEELKDQEIESMVQKDENQDRAKFLFPDSELIDNRFKDPKVLSTSQRPVAQTKREKIPGFKFPDHVSSSPQMTAMKATSTTEATTRKPKEKKTKLTRSLSPSIRCLYNIFSVIKLFLFIMVMYNNNNL
jgi:hypothetical protein